MEFTLFYDGKLKGNGSVHDKHEIRMQFHEQLKTLWNQKPLNGLSSKLLAPTYEFTAIRKIGDFTFAPLVYESIKLVAKLDITILRPEEPGAIITQAGDIDNRLKTVFDALRMPSKVQELPGHWTQNKDSNPMLCVLEDDNLIVDVNVKTDRLLRPAKSPLDVIMLIKIITKATEVTMLNLSLN